MWLKVEAARRASALIFEMKVRAFQKIVWTVLQLLIPKRKIPHLVVNMKILNNLQGNVSSEG